MISQAAFVGALRSCRLLDLPQLGALNHSAALSGDDPLPLARQLLQRGWLTPYQINQVLSGHAPGLVLGSYVLLERLGEGGMGQVYKARHQKLGRVVALKVIRKERTTDVEAISRFRREIEAVSRLSHPNIVLALDADEADGTLFYAMEYVEGINLREHVQRLGPLPVGLACEYVRQAALGLEHIAAHGLVHRDIKPSNLILVNGAAVSGEWSKTGTAQVKILDLGLARLRFGCAGEDVSADTLTRNGVVMGTPDYIAAEQAANPHGADVRADLYSLGCTLYFLLSGSVPFPGGTAVAKLFRHRGEQPDPIEKRCAGLPRNVGDIVRKLMAKRPDDRFQTPAELAKQLEQITGAAERPTARGIPTPRETTGLTVPDLVTGRNPVHLMTTPPPRTTRHAPRSRYWWWLSGAALVAVLAGGLWSFLPSERGAEGEETARQAASSASSTGELVYVRRPTRNQTILATLKANGLPTLQGTWHYIGPFEYWRHHNDSRGFKEAYPPEKELDLTKTYKGKGDRPVGWKQFPSFGLGEIVDLRLFSDNDGACVYLWHEFEAAEARTVPLALGSDDTLTVWLNGQCLIARETQRGCAPDQDLVSLALKPGKNQLLIKVCNVNGPWSVYVMPQLPLYLDKAFGASLRRDFR